MGAEDESRWEIRSKQFRNRKTGEIVTQIPILQINDYEEVN